MSPGMSMTDALVAVGLVESRNAARRAVADGAASVNGVKIADPEHVHYVPDWQQAADYTASIARPGDYVITLGCGNVYQIIPQVLESLRRTDGA